MSLKESLIEYLQRNKRLDLNQLYSLCGRERKKCSNGERRLRELMSPLHKDFNPNIKAEKNGKGAIVAYIWESSVKEGIAIYPPARLGNTGSQDHNASSSLASPLKPMLLSTREFLTRFAKKEEKKELTLF